MNPLEVMDITKCISVYVQLLKQPEVRPQREREHKDHNSQCFQNHLKEIHFQPYLSMHKCTKLNSYKERFLYLISTKSIQLDHKTFLNHPICATLRVQTQLFLHDDEKKHRDDIFSGKVYWQAIWFIYSKYHCKVLKTNSQMGGIIEKQEGIIQSSIHIL